MCGAYSHWRTKPLTPTYTTLEWKLEDLALAVEKGRRPVGLDAILHGEYKGVEIDLWGNLDYVVRWLEVNGAAIIEVRTNHIYAAVPVRLLRELSRQRGIKRVAEPERFLSPCIGCKPQLPGLAAMVVGQTKKFFVFSSLDYPAGNRVMVNNPGDTADLSLDSCADSQNIGPAIYNGEYLTIAACTPGEAIVSLLFYDDSPGQEVWRAERQYRVSVSNPPPVTVTPEMSVIKVGQSRTFTLDTTVKHPDSIRVIINDYEYYDPKGNVSFGDCPGKKGDSKILNNGDPVTITGCSVGVGDVDFYQGSARVLDDGMWVWTD